MPGDQLVQINGESVQGVPHGKVVEKLHAVSRARQPLAMIVARTRPAFISSHQQQQLLQKEVEVDRQVEKEVGHAAGSVEDDEQDSSEDEDDEEVVG